MSCAEHRELVALFDALEPDPSWSFAGCTTRDTTRLSHGYHRYPAKFIPQLVDRLLDEYLGEASEACVNDPFMGSGTAVVCAIERGYRATGTDINDVAYLITRAKATPIEPKRLERCLAKWSEDLQCTVGDDGMVKRLSFLPASEHDPLSPHVPHHEQIDYWFPAAQKRDLGIILAAIRRVEDEDIQTFLLCCFSHILKNCSVWMTGSTKPTRSRTKRPAAPWPTFLRHLQYMVRRNADFWAAVPPAVRARPHAFLDVRCQDARRQPCPDTSVDILITSSPYVTSYEHADLHQLTALWLEYARDLKAFRRKFIGTGFPHERPIQIQSSLGREIVAALTEQDARLGTAAGHFFMDMEETFQEAWRILKPGARACYVIGNTRLKGVEILNAQVFAEGLLATGFVLERVILREIPSKILPQTRDPVTGRFTSPENDHFHAYPVEYIVIARKP
ncbi:MAG: DNA methyltransferase [Anaerolineae bacterium]